MFTFDGMVSRDSTEGFVRCVVAAIGLLNLTSVCLPAASNVTWQLCMSCMGRLHTVIGFVCVVEGRLSRQSKLLAD